MNHSSRAQSIIDFLSVGPVTVYNLAATLDCPEASVRRTIQVLRRQGHNIAFAKDGEYRMGPSHTPTVETGWPCVTGA